MIPAHMSAITISGRVTPEYAQILSEEALAFVAALQRNSPGAMSDRKSVV